VPVPPFIFGSLGLQSFFLFVLPDPLSCSSDSGKGSISEEKDSLLLRDFFGSLRHVVRRLSSRNEPSSCSSFVL